MEKNEKKPTNKEKALRQMDVAFGFLDQVSCKGADLDNMARARELFRSVWNLLHAPDEPEKEVKQDG